ncbi:odorant receptor 4-like [Venturia canescens]|uniref:odorant receptor 4-like n=1 Tax=Venturia canescens TaxID=32260 RepID=UPI001C9CB60D|nr:odorant receptor 4-like [Venturia canescens]
MTSDNPGYVYAYGWNRFNMGIIGAWPENNQNFILKNRSLIFAAAVFSFIWLPLTASVAFLRDDLKQLIDCLVIIVPVGMAISKLVLFRVRRPVLEVILSAMAEDWSVERTSEERSAMFEKAKYGRFISIMSVSLAVSMLVTLSSFGIWSASYQRQFITNETKLAIGLLYPAYFPYDTKELRGYLPTWFGQFFASIVSLIGYSGPDSSMAMMILHLCGQLATVRLALTKIVDEECIKDSSIYWKRLSTIIRRHEELNRCGELLERSFNGMLLVQTVLCTLIFCFQGFVTFTTLLEGLTGDENFPFLEMAFIIIHGFYTIIHLFVYCWTGDLLVFESTALSRAPYESDWFRLPPAQARALMMVTNRSRIPLQITAGKFVGFSLELFTSIMKTSMSYLSVLLAMMNS